MKRPRIRVCERGNALMEFAFAFTMVSVLLTGVFRFGYRFYVSNNLQKNIRAGATFAAQKAYTPGPGLTTSNIEIVPIVDSNMIPQEITVRVSRTLPFNLSAVVGSTRLAGKPAVTSPYTGIYSAVPRRRHVCKRRTNKPGQRWSNRR